MAELPPSIHPMTEPLPDIHPMAELPPSIHPMAKPPPAVHPTAKPPPAIILRPSRRQPSIPPRPPYLDQPNSGGAAHAKAMIQEKATPMMAWFSPKRKLLMGLQTTTYLSIARTTSDQRAISPAPGRERDGDNRDFEQQEEKNVLMAARGLLGLLFPRKTPASR